MSQGELNALSLTGGAIDVGELEPWGRRYDVGKLLRCRLL